MNANKTMQSPPSRWLGNRFSLLGGEGRLMVFEGLADALLQGGVHEHTHRHHHQQRHDTFGLFAVQCRGSQRWGLQKTEAACRMPLACVPV